MSTAARKARKRAGVSLVKPARRPTWPPAPPRGLGLVSEAEIITSLVVHGRP